MVSRTAACSDTLYTVHYTHFPFLSFPFLSVQKPRTMTVNTGGLRRHRSVPDFRARKIPPRFNGPRLSYRSREMTELRLFRGVPPDHFSRSLARPRRPHSEEEFVVRLSLGFSNVNHFPRLFSISPVGIYRPTVFAGFVLDRHGLRVSPPRARESVQGGIRLQFSGALGRGRRDSHTMPPPFADGSES
jgi:hypothetical protein